MRVIQKKIENEQAKLYYEQFDNYQEFLRVVEERDKTNAHGRHTLKHNASQGSWCGVDNYEQARNLLINGWDAKVEYLKQQFDKESKLLEDKKVIKLFDDVVGFMPNVPNAIIGLPNSMRNMKVEHRKSKIIKFLIDTDTSGCVDANEMIEYFSKTLARIAVLEKQGYRCRIEVFNNFSERYQTSGTKTCFSILIKNENQPFDIKRMAFPLAHIAMNRVLGFGWQNSLPISNYNSNEMGHPLYVFTKEGRERILNAIKNGNEKLVHIYYGKDLDKIFGKEVK